MNGRAWAALMLVLVTALGGAYWLSRPSSRDGRSAARDDAGKRRDVEFVTSDRVIISATFREAMPGAPALVLVPPLAGDRGDWEGFAPGFVEAGFSTLALDLRGTGRSVSVSPSKARYAPPRRRAAHLARAERDLTAAARFLRRRGVPRVAVIGWSESGNLAWRASRAPGIHAAVALDPALPADRLPAREGQPPAGVLFISDRLQIALPHELSAITARPKRVAIGHGQIGAAGRVVDPGSRREILNWLRERLRPGRS